MTLSPIFQRCRQHLEPIRTYWIPLSLAVLALLFLYRGVENYKERLGLNMQTRRILVAAKPLAEGHVITAGDLASSEIPEKYVPMATLYESDRPKAIGHIVMRPMAGGELVLWSSLDVNYGPANPARRITSGYRAMAVPVDTISSVAQAIRPGDRIDIFATASVGEDQKSPSTFILLQNVTVLSVGDAGAQNPKTGYGTLTLMVLPKEAGLITFASQQARLTFVLRNPDDYKVESDLPRITETQLAEAAFRNSIQQERNHFVEIIRAGKLSLSQALP